MTLKTLFQAKLTLVSVLEYGVWYSWYWVNMVQWGWIVYDSHGIEMQN